LKSNHIVTAALIFALAGCSTQNAQKDSATASSDSVERANDLTDVGFGCRVDLKSACSEWISRPVVPLTNGDMPPSRIGQSTGPSPSFFLPVAGPNSKLLATIDCKFRRVGETVKVTDASLLSGPPISKEEIEYVRSQGLCADEGTAPATVKKNIDRVIDVQEKQYFKGQ